MSVDHALQYGGRGLKVFPVSRGKVPFKDSHGHLDATSDPDGIEALWRPHPKANVALAVAGMVVLDADGAKGLATLQGLARAAGGLPRTLTARTPRGGLHLYYRLPAGVELRSRSQKREQSGDDGFDWKAPGGYVLLPPSRTATGRYVWELTVPIATATPAMLQWLRQHGATVPTSQDLGLGERPAHLGGAAGPELVGRTLAALDVPWSGHEEARLRSALGALSAAGYDTWSEYGMALHHLNWDRSDGTSIGFDIWVEWSATCDAKFSYAACEAKWLSFGRNTENRRLKTVGSIYHAAGGAGWTGTIAAPKEEEKTPEINGVHALPAALTEVKCDPIVFPDTNKVGRPTATCRNARVAIRGLGVACQVDAFHGKMLVGGHAIEQWAGEITDDVLHMLRVAIEREFRFDPGLVNVHDAAVQECLQHRFDPVVDYLGGLAWDGTPRLAHWLHRYLAADDTPLNSETGGLMLVAAVRRARRPGVKFDPIIVLEGKEGTRKSSAIEVLAGAENFSDQTILGAGDREVQELVQGVWLYEIADLTGISKADTERVKAFASRKIDRARPAFGRVRVDRPRRCVFFATTNDSTYLRSETGNRRFWPVRTGRIGLDALARDRDQLWAEAAMIEARGVSLTLAERLWEAAAIEQDARREHDPWDDLLAAWVPRETGPITDGTGKTEWRVPSKDLLDLVLRLPTEKQGPVTAKRLAYAMRRLGWDGPKVMRHEGAGKDVPPFRGYSKPVTGNTA